MKILAIASAGGHWVQLLRLRPAFVDHDLVFASTKPGFEKMVPDHEFYLVKDSNRNAKAKLFQTLIDVNRMIKKVKPDMIITTGAAPGLMALLLGRVRGCKTVWIDSVANVEKLSLSGYIASKFASRVYTQWSDLATSTIIYKGNVLS